MAPSIEQTLALIKPDAVGAGSATKILDIISKDGFTVVKQEVIQLSKVRAQQFYAEHEGKPFYEALTEFMCSGPIFALCLAKSNAIKAWRTLMGPTNSDKAREESPNSIRALFGKDNTQNAAHGSDSPGSAHRELKFFFPDLIVDPLPSDEEATEILNAKVIPLVSKGVAELCKQKPANPVVWLAEWLMENNPNRPTRIDMSVDSRVILVVGAPGIKSDAICTMLSDEFKFESLSLTKLLDAEVQAKTPTGKSIEAYLNNNQPVPTEVSIALLRREISQKQGATFLINGFPLNMDDARTLEKEVAYPDMVISIDAPLETLEQTVGKQDGGSVSEQSRKDLDAYLSDTVQVVEFYGSQNKMQKIDGSGPIETVYDATRTLF